MAKNNRTQVWLVVASVVVLAVIAANIFGGEPDGLVEAASYRANLYGADPSRAKTTEARGSGGEALTCKGQQVYCVVMPTAPNVDLAGKMGFDPPRTCPWVEGAVTLKFYRDPDTGNWQDYPDLSPAACQRR